jgi:hypothetical protein
VRLTRVVGIEHIMHPAFKINKNLENLYRSGLGEFLTTGPCRCIDGFNDLYIALRRGDIRLSTLIAQWVALVIKGLALLALGIYWKKIF